MGTPRPIPPPLSPKPTPPPTPPPEKKTPSIFGERGYVKSSWFKKELEKDKYFEKFGIEKKIRTEIGELLGKGFGELIEKSEAWKLRSLINELKSPGSSSDPKIKEIAKTVREKIGWEKTKKIANWIDEEFFGKKQ